MTKKLKKIISIVCISVVAVCSIGNVCFAEQASDKFVYTVDSKFNDVKTSDWFYEAVSKCEDLGIICGYGDGNFGPNDNITMQQVCLITNRCEMSTIGYYDDPDTPLKDYGKGGTGINEHTSPIYYAKRQGFVGYWPGENSLPKNPRFVTFKDYDKNAYREEALSCFYRAYTLKNFANTIKPYKDAIEETMTYIENPNIPDYSEISDLFKEHIYEAYKIGLATGYDSTGLFKPQNEITRAEFCQMIFNSGLIEALHAKKEGLL